MSTKNSTEEHEKMLCAGARLKQLREEANLTQIQLAELIDALPENTRSGRSEKQISYIENGQRSISANYARLLAKIFNIKPEYLLLETDFKTDLEEKEYSESYGKSIESLLYALGYRVEYSSKERFFKTYINKRRLAWNDLSEIVNEYCNSFPVYERQLVAPDGRRITIYTDEILEIVSEINEYAKWKLERKFNEIHRYKYGSVK